MKGTGMFEEPAAHSMVNWYVSRRLDLLSDELADVELPTKIAASNGVTLVLDGVLEVDDVSYRSFTGVLAYPGKIAGKVRVEVDLNPYSSRFVEIGIRPSRRLPRLLVSADRYFDGAWAVLDSLAVELAERRAERAA